MTEQRSSKKRLIDAALRSALIPYEAVEDPEGYDGGETLLQLERMAELLSTAHEPGAAVAAVLEDLEQRCQRGFTQGETPSGEAHHAYLALCKVYGPGHGPALTKPAELPIVPWNDGWAIRPTHEAADAFWKYWRENGETHKHGYYESTWGAINQALRAVQRR